MPESKTLLDVRNRLAASAGMLDRLLHDFKQPLNLVRLIAQDLRLDARKGRLELAEVPDQMGEIIGAVDDLVRSLNRLREFAPPGGSVVGSLACDVAAACRRAIARQRENWPQAEIDEILTAALPTVPGDPFYLEQAVWELVENALRAARPTGRAQATVEALRVDEEVHVRVTNRGEPIPSAVLDHLFEPFVSGEDGKAGLGLHLARTLIHDLGGRLELSMTGAEGTTFAVCLPLAPEDDTVEREGPDGGSAARRREPER